MKKGDRFVSDCNEEWVFLENYNTNRAFDFIAINEVGQFRNFTNNQVKTKLGTRLSDKQIKQLTNRKKDETTK